MWTLEIMEIKRSGLVLGNPGNNGRLMVLHVLQTHSPGYSVPRRWMVTIPSHRLVLEGGIFRSSPGVVYSTLRSKLDRGSGFTSYFVASRGVQVVDSIVRYSVLLLACPAVAIFHERA